MAAPAFVKNPKFISGTIIFLWVAYVVYWNYRLNPIDIQLVPFVKPVTVTGLTEPVAVGPVGEAVTAYWVTGEPPSDEGAVKLTVACAVLLLADTPVGAPGTVLGVTALDAADAALIPFAFVAWTVNV